MLATTIHKSNTTPHHQRWSDNNQTPSSEADPNTEGHNTPGFPQSGRRGDGLVVSKPNSVSGSSITGNSDESRSGSTFVVHQNHTHYRCDPSIESLRSPNPHTMWAGLSLVVLLRKEVIQPHLPVRLPCYDFVPIADPTFDGSLPKGLGHRLRVLPTFMT
jgi:hypothetical protein